MFCSILGYLIGLAKNLIALCNDNAGFISAILAVITILISVKIGRLPYQKKLSFYHYLDSDETNEIIATVYVSNVGSCPVYIDKLIAKDGFFKTIGQCEQIPNTTLIDDRLLEPQKNPSFQNSFKRIQMEFPGKKGCLTIHLNNRKKEYYISNQLVYWVTVSPTLIFLS